MLHETAQPVAVLGESREGQVAIAAGQHEGDPRGDEKAERQQPPCGNKALRRGLVSHRFNNVAEIGAEASLACRSSGHLRVRLTEVVTASP